MACLRAQAPQRIPSFGDVCLQLRVRLAPHVGHEAVTLSGCRALAEALGNQEAAQLLDQTLEEEKSTDQKLNQIALSEVNNSALRAAA